MNQIKRYISFSFGLSFALKRKFKGTAIPIEIWHLHQETSDKKITPTTFRGGFFMPKNEIQITE